MWYNADTQMCQIGQFVGMDKPLIKWWIDLLKKYNIKFWRKH